MLRNILRKSRGTLFYNFLKKISFLQKFKRKIISFKGSFLVQSSDGASFFLYNPPYNLETTIYWQGIDNISWEKKTREVWNNLCRYSNTIFDIGANSGFFSISAKAYNPKSSVYAFEPQPNVFEILRKNNEINKFDIICSNLALSDNEGIFPFYNYGENTFTKNNTTAGSLNSNWRIKKQHSIDVKVVTLNSFIEENSIDKIDLMKIDVETLEYEVLMGFNKYLFVFEPIIILEVINFKLGQKVKALFVGREYSFYHINEDKGLVSVSELGKEKGYGNYVICPKSKIELIQKISGNNIDSTK